MEDRKTLSQVLSDHVDILAVALLVIGMGVPAAIAHRQEMQSQDVRGVVVQPIRYQIEQFKIEHSDAKVKLQRGKGCFREAIRRAFRASGV